MDDVRELRQKEAAVAELIQCNEVRIGVLEEMLRAVDQRRSLTNDAATSTSEDFRENVPQTATVATQPLLVLAAYERTRVAEETAFHSEQAQFCVEYQQLIEECSTLRAVVQKRLAN